MRQLTVRERLIVTAMLPALLAFAVAPMAAALAPWAGPGVAPYLLPLIALSAGALVITAIWFTAHDLSRSLTEAADTIDAIADSVLESAPPLAECRGEVERVRIATDRLADTLRERHRREIVHSDLDRTWQTARRANLSSLAQKGRGGDRGRHAIDRCWRRQLGKNPKTCWQRSKRCGWRSTKPPARWKVRAP